MVDKIKKLGFIKAYKVRYRAGKNCINDLKTIDINYPSKDTIELVLVFKKKNYDFKNNDSLKKIEKDISDITGTKIKIKTKIEKEIIKEKKENSLKSNLTKAAKILKEEWDKAGEDVDKKKYEEIDSPKKNKGGLLNFIAGAAAANVAKNRMSPPTVVFNNPNIVVTGMEPVGVQWRIKYGERKNGRINNLGSFTIGRNTRSSSVGGGCTFAWAK